MFQTRKQLIEAVSRESLLPELRESESGDSAAGRKIASLLDGVSVDNFEYAQDEAPEELGQWQAAVSHARSNLAAALKDLAVSVNSANRQLAKAGAGQMKSRRGDVLDSLSHGMVAVARGIGELQGLLDSRPGD